MNRCSTCKFHEAYSHQCRYDPPKGVPVGVGKGPTGEPAVQTVSFFPVVKDVDWCGKHEPDLTNRG